MKFFWNRLFIFWMFPCTNIICTHFFIFFQYHTDYIYVAIQISQLSNITQTTSRSMFSYFSQQTYKLNNCIANLYCITTNKLTITNSSQNIQQYSTIYKSFSKLTITYYSQNIQKYSTISKFPNLNYQYKIFGRQHQNHIA